MNTLTLWMHRDWDFSNTVIIIPFGESLFGVVVYDYYNNCSERYHIATMGDNGGDRTPEIDEEEQTKEVNDVAMEVIRQALLETTLEIGKREDADRIFANARSFVKLSQGNDTVQRVILYLYEAYHRDTNTLRVLGKGFSNLEALQVLTIRFEFGSIWDTRRHERVDDRAEREVAESLFWQAFAGALGQLRHHIELRLDGEYWKETDLINLAAAIQGVSTIRTFHSDKDTIEWESANTLLYALASLPSLENVTLEYFYNQGGPPGGDFPGLTDLMMSSSLRSIEFYKIPFISGLSRALLAAFEEGSFVTDLRFFNCYLGHEEDEDQIRTLRELVLALQTNLSVKTLSLDGNNFSGLFCDGITTALLVNTTLEDLTLRTDWEREDVRWLQPLFAAMRINTSLKSLDVDTFHLTDQLVCGALRDMLAQNSVLESLTLNPPENVDDASVVSWRKTLPFIRDNAALKSLTISFDGDALDPHVATLCFDTVTMLEGNTTLECLDVKSGGIGPDAYFAALERLQPSSSLKTLRLSPVLASMGEEEMNQVALLVRKNYSLAVLDEDISAHDKTGEVGTLLRLNQAGRGYLINDAASIAKGVEVLIGVSDDLGCLFYHLLENPTLCDIEHQYTTKSGTGAHLNKRQHT
jgi:hypothetical protein